MTTDRMRTCTKCSQTKPLAFFFKHKPNHWRRECRDCTKKRRKHHEAENTERPFRVVPLDLEGLYRSGRNCWCCRRTTPPNSMLCRICSTERPLDNRKREARNSVW